MKISYTLAADKYGRCKSALLLAIFEVIGRNIFQATQNKPGNAGQRGDTLPNSKKAPQDAYKAYPKDNDARV